VSASERVALVSGGTGALGEAICRQLAEAKLCVVALHSHANPRVASWLADHDARGYRFGSQAVDVSDFASCAAAVQAVRSRHGPISVLVNNAGITRDASFRKMTPGEWSAVLRTNLDSMFNLTKQVIEDMIGLGWGRIVNISSVSGQRGAFGQANYAASKAGIHGFTKSLALEVAKHHVTVNTVSPGYLRSPMVERVPQELLRSRVLPEIAVGRLGEPDEVARLVAYLVSDGAAFVTGANLAINGGQHMF